MAASMNGAKRKKPVGAAANGAADGVAGDAAAAVTSMSADIEDKHEHFLTAFEKPTQIYRYLRVHALKSPSFMHRSLSYMKPRMSRNNKRRATFKVEEFGKQQIDLHTRINDSADQNLVISLNSIKDDELLRSNIKYARCNVDMSIAKVALNKRKDVPLVLEPVGCGEIAVNPGPCHNDSDIKPFIIRMPYDKLKAQRGSKVYLFVSIWLPRESSENCAISDNERDQKRRKRGESGSAGFFYQAELIASTDGQNISLAEGDYELTLKRRVQNSQPTMPPVKNTNKLDWRMFENNENENIKMPFKDNPVLMMRILSCANGDELQTNGRLKSSQNPIKKEVLNGQIIKIELSTNGAATATANGTNGAAADAASTTTVAPSPPGVKILYRFMHKNETQWTTSYENCNCPWCYLKCLEPRPLCNHLRYCHSRFNFTFNKETKNSRVEMRIDVSVNENYDGSYSGNPFDLSYSTTGYAFSRNGPVRRAPVTMIIVGGKRAKRGEGIDPDDEDMDFIHPVIMGHDRLYYHTNTCLPIRPQDMNIDSEEENDPEWMRTKTQLMIDEFSDVNEGEKEVMKMWNLHVMKHGFVADCQMFDACKIFIAERGHDIFAKALNYNFLLHLENMYDFGFFDAVQKRELLIQLHTLREEGRNASATSVDVPTAATADLSLNSPGHSSELCTE